MAGTLIMRGPIDDVPQIRAARDIVLAIQDIGLFPSDNPDDAGKDIWNYEPQQNAIWQTFKGIVTKYDPAQGEGVPTIPPLNSGFTTGDYPLRYFLMNGEPFFKEAHNSAVPLQPVPTQLPVQRIAMRPGEVVRFRMLNACSDNLMPILVEDHEMHLIALDGINFESVRTMPANPLTGPGQVLLAPANRAEFLIKGNARPGVYRVLQLAQDQQFLESARKTICEIEIVGEAMDMALPTALPPPTRYYPLIKPQDIERVRTVEFGGAFPGVANPYVGIDFLLNNMQYQVEAIPTVVRLGDEEEWHLVVSGPHHGGTEGHPFHIHEVSFEVIRIGEAVQLPGTIMDTIWIPKDTEVVVRMRFLGWPGKTVFHCHILPHEDTGMMQNFLIVDPGGAGHH
jgi:FtsP/CotA-like multicopper oxidase with cupredoxin domain